MNKLVAYFHRFFQCIYEKKTYLHSTVLKKSILTVTFTALLFSITAINTANAGENITQLDLLPYKSSIKGAYTALQIKLKPEWDTYWRFAGEAGQAPIFKWDKSENVKSISVLYPAPMRFTQFDMTSFIYRNEVKLPIEVEFVDVSKPAHLVLGVDLNVCNQQCVPESHELSFDLGTVANSVSSNPYADNLPERINGSDVKKVWFDEADKGKSSYNMILKGVRNYSQDVDMFVESPVGFTVEKPIVTIADGDTYIKSPIRNVVPKDVLIGMIKDIPMNVTITDGLKSYEFSHALGDEAPVKADADFKSATSTIPASGLNLKILFIALLGGLILNFMPCVLPVITLKVMSVLKHSDASPKEIVKSFTATALGILFSFWILAGSLISLRAFGFSIGWGIQFQYPPFLFFLIATVLLFALNLLGLFEIALPAKLNDKINSFGEGGSVAGEFMSGMLATLLATPCSAPFLGTALAFALSSSNFDIMAIFTYMGIGLAMPYIVLACVPQAFTHLPKPGAWMVNLRRFLGATLLVTAAWLISVLLGIYSAGAVDGQWEKFDENKIAYEVKKGNVVFVDITAQWCLTCKANKKLVLDKAEAEEFFTNNKIVKMQGDWTKKDEVISKYLQAHNRFGIPFYIMYGPHAENGIVMPELLSLDGIHATFNKAK